MSLLMLAAPCGTELKINAEGDDAEQALEAIQALFDARFEGGSVAVACAC
ncbi:hypothetical protein HORIV_26020 [Vreelandella olivaria]|uniref:HPr domain-containing protein n=1 Tax=Vreelandella olivaria TaxID=390919 RepID=A0ABM7GHS4_9GAMM|nr:hypothetical protein HORIV_26020 [Halomonas olivaria]